MPKVYFGMKEYTSLPDVVSEEIDNVDLNCLYDQRNTSLLLSGMTNYDSNQINQCIMLTHITFMGVYCMCIYAYFYNNDNNVNVYIYMLIFLMKLLYFVYEPQKAVRQYVIKFVFVFVSFYRHVATTHKLNCFGSKHFELICFIRVRF